MLSSLMVNRSKLEIQFSPNTPRLKRKEFASQLGVKVVTKFRKYLGTYIDRPYSRKDKLVNFGVQFYIRLIVLLEKDWGSAVDQRNKKGKKRQI